MAMNDVPNHLIVAARTGFLAAAEKTDKYEWPKVAELFPVTAKSQTLVDLGAAPMPVENKTRPQMQGFIEKSKSIKPTSWEITVGISYDDVKDDQTGNLLRKVKSAGSNFQRHINKRVFQVLNAGDASTYGLCYDGNEFFDTQHADDGAAYSTVQANLGTSALSIDNFETALIAARGIKDDQGEYCNFAYNQLVVSRELERTAFQIVKNPNAYDTGNNELNPYAGRFAEPIVSPYLDSTAWIMVATQESTKPLIVAMREKPHLQDYGFNSQAVKGGLYWFKFYGRYEVHYADWRLAYMGKS